MKRSNMKSVLAIANWKTKPAEKGKNVVAKKNWILFWFNASRKKNKKLRLSNFKEKFKVSNISRDSKKKTKLTNKLPLKGSAMKKEGNVLFS